LLGSDVRRNLISVEISFKVQERSVDRNAVVTKITTLAMEKSSDRDRASEYREAFTALIKWFRKNPESAQALFPLLYSRRHLKFRRFSGRVLRLFETGILSRKNVV